MMHDEPSLALNSDVFLSFPLPISHNHDTLSWKQNMHLYTLTPFITIYDFYSRYRSTRIISNMN